MQTFTLPKKGLTVGIIVLFIGINSISVMGQNFSFTMVHNNVSTDGTRIWTQIQKLLASDGLDNANFGWSVSIYEDTAIIGAPGDLDSKGSVYIFTCINNVWTQQQKLIASDGTAGDNFGYSVSLDGNTALIGAYGDNNYKGAAYVFTSSGTTWSQQAKLIASDGVTGDCFGYYVSLSGDTAVIGAPHKDFETGSTYVFIRIDSNWTQQQKLLASNGKAWDSFGFSISVEGDMAVIGSIWANGGNVTDSGAAYVFTRSGVTWTEQQILYAIDGYSNEVFGHSVSLDGDTILIGARFDNDYAGSAYVFTYSGMVWEQQQKLTASDPGVHDSFGISVALKGDIALVGAMDEISEDDPGAAYVFTQNGTSWIQQAELLPSDGEPGDWFGGRVSLYGSTALIGANYDDDEGYNSGSAYIFKPENLPPNHPPYVTDLSGPTSGKVGVDYRFNVTVIDPDNDNVSCIWDWGDGTTSGWQGPFANGTTMNIFHAWAAEGTYDIKVKPRDQHDLEGEWSNPFVITINQSLTPTFIFGKYGNLTTGGNYIIITAVNIRMFTTQPFQFLHDIDGQKVTFSKNNFRAVIFPHFIIGIVNVLS